MPPARTSPVRSRSSSRLKEKQSRPAASPGRTRAAPAKASSNKAKAVSFLVTNAVDERRAELEAVRGAMSLSKTPLTVCSRFLQATATFFASTIVSQAMRREALVTYAALAMYAWSRHSMIELYAVPTCEPDFTPGGALYLPQLYAYEVAWWLMLGILSSIGFGTGLHSGIMFLWPHVVTIITKAHECKSTNFAAAYNHECSMKCISREDGSDDFWSIFLRILPWVIVWGSGTAMGELPPFFITRAARRSGGRATDFEAELDEAKGKMAEGAGDFVSWLKVKTIEFTEKNGFIGILLLASWPNAAFDMCGMACGWLEMPFWTFFGATLIGKGLIKVSLQTIVMIGMFGPAMWKLVQERLIPSVPLPASACKAVALSADINCTLVDFLSGGRNKALLTFSMQTRYSTAGLLAGKPSLDVNDLTAKLCGVMSDACAKAEDGSYTGFKYEAMLEKAKRSVSFLDRNGDGQINEEELGEAVSNSDGKLSLAALDPGTGKMLSPGNLWNGFIVLLVLFFVYSIVEQVAISAQAAADEAELAALEARLTAACTTAATGGPSGSRAKKAKAE
eukprot:CAMPEP_0174739230 /NCGR_PEP_ID=MMETSP1094-20130205/71241_1 /TAXON_ID=156173 /ORGANISM="Chrysochromulina brevifilum, Strain UTEX LB 985" /LENGTH=564 /DNA_ID=CAMNT_0015942761 /DNA_START=69 /DNA_END=1763 /DNA_ORIENTATION=-